MLMIENTYILIFEDEDSGMSLKHFSHVLVMFGIDAKKP